jgi:protein-S-isoprenylcysteine O-methyltransferase Ste14
MSGSLTAEIGRRRPPPRNSGAKNMPQTCPQLFPMKSLEHKIPPPVLTVVIALAMWGSSKLQSPIPIEPRLKLALTALVGLFALTFALSGVLSFRRAKTTINPVQIDQASRVVSTGIYRITRNPMYVGLTGLLTAWAVHLAVPLAFLGPAVFALFTHRFQILPEERAMEARFEREYLEYKKRVRRWL